MSALDLTILDADIERERDGSGGCVAVFLYGQDDFFHVQTQVFGGGVNDAFIGLVRDEPVDLIGGITCFADDFVGNFCEHFDCEFEHTRPIHRNVGRAANLSVGDLTGHVEQVEVVAVSFEFAVNDAVYNLKHFLML